MPSNVISAANWAETLAQFLRDEPGVEAVRIDAATRKVTVATLGQVDLVQLEVRLAETLAAVESQLGKSSAAPAGYSLRQEGSLTELSELSCATAPKFWKWREVDWPEESTSEASEESEWRELSALAAACGVFGLSAFFV